MERFGKIERETETIGRKKFGRSLGGNIGGERLPGVCAIRRGGETEVMGNIAAAGPSKCRLTAKIERAPRLKQ